MAFNGLCKSILLRQKAFVNKVRLKNHLFLGLKLYNMIMIKKDGLETYQKVGIIFLVVVIAGCVGWAFEFLLGLAETGRFYMKGGNFLPWMNIYAFGALMMILIGKKLKKNPTAVFLVSAIAAGMLELVAGWLVYTIWDGARYWNYNEGIWVIGSIGGFVCLFSVLGFGVYALILTYLLLPFLEKVARKMPRRRFLTLAVSLFSLVMIDEMTNLTLKNLGMPTAMDFYSSRGLEYRDYSD